MYIGYIYLFSSLISKQNFFAGSIKKISKVCATHKRKYRLRLGKQQLTQERVRR